MILTDTAATHLKSSADALIAHTLECAKAEGLLDDTLADAKKNIKGQGLEDSYKILAELPLEQRATLGKVFGAEQLTKNAVGSMYRKIMTPPPAEFFGQYFSEGLRQPEQQDVFLSTLEKLHKEMIISVVQTMHPTIYHSQFARESEKEMTEAFEKLGDAVKEGDQSKSETLLEKAKASIARMVKGVKQGAQITPDRQVTITEENSLDRDDHLVMQQAFKNVVSSYNQALLDTAQKMREDGTLSEDQARRLEAATIADWQAIWRTWAYGADADGRDGANSIVLSEGVHYQVHSENGKDVYRSRRRDIRENAGDQKQCVSGLIQRTYRKSRTFRDFVSDFNKENEAQYGAQRRDWKEPDNENDPLHSTLVQLSDPEQQEFLCRLITDGYDTKGEYHEMPEKVKNNPLVPPSLKAQTIAFNTTFREEYRKFVHDNLPEEIKQVKTPEGETIDILPELSALRSKLLAKYNGDKDTAKKKEEEFLENIHKHWVACGEDGEFVRFKLDLDSLLYYPDEGENRSFFEHTLKTEFKKDAQGKEVATNEKLTEAERRKSLDSLKRLHVLDDGIEHLGNHVADRYQIANFENASDFYSSLLLFKEAGIIEVEKGRVVRRERNKDGEKIVTSPKLSLQPLLETAQDQKNAVAIFTELLENPLVLSYYRALGNKADIMLGYSDGSKSAGNFASEWSIRKCGRDLESLFASKGIALNVFHGRGRGDSRGGQFDEGQDYRMADPALHRKPNFDQTMQGDGHLTFGLSPSQGERSLSSMVVGIATATQEAEEALRKKIDWAKENRPDLSASVGMAREPNFVPSPDYLQKQHVARSRIDEKWKQSTIEGHSFVSQESAIESIAQQAETTFNKLCVDDGDTVTFLMHVHNNDYRSSRAASREANPVYDKVRMITMEYGLNMPDAPLLYVGLKTALDAFEKNGKVLEKVTRQGKDGEKTEEEREVTGKRALEVLYTTHPFFRGEIDKTEFALRNFNPEAFRDYAKVIGVEDWAERCITELTGLREQVQSIRKFETTRDAMKTLKPGDPMRPAPLAGRLSLDETIRRVQMQKAADQMAQNEFLEMDAELAKNTRALALSTAYENGELKSKDELGYNPFKPIGPDDKQPTQDQQWRASIMRDVSFVLSEISGRLKGLFIPAATRAATQGMPYLDPAVTYAR